MKTNRQQPKVTRASVAQLERETPGGITVEVIAQDYKTMKKKRWTVKETNPSYTILLREDPIGTFTEQVYLNMDSRPINKIVPNGLTFIFSRQVKPYDKSLARGAQ